MKFLITGGTGFLGSHLTKTLLRDEHEVLLLSRQHHPLFAGRERFHEVVGNSFADGREAGEIFERFRPDAVVHLAAVTNIAENERIPDDAARLHVSLTHSLAKLSETFSAHFVFASTDQVFDGNLPPSPGGFSTESVPDPRSTYAKTKRAGELAALEHSGSVLRIALMYGEPIGELRGILGWMHERLSTGQEVSLFDDEWRTPVLVHDVVRAVTQISTTKLPGIFHAAGTTRLTRVEFGFEYAEAQGFDPGLISPVSRLSLPGPIRAEDLTLSPSPAFRFHSTQEGLRLLVQVLEHNEISA